MHDFFTYIYLDTRFPGKHIYADLVFDFLPIYVGKGHRTRDTDHLKDCFKSKGSCHYSTIFYRLLRNLLKNNNFPIIKRLKDGLSEKQAFDYEIEVISKIGRLCNQTGPLVNKLPGGEGWNSEFITEKNKNNWKIIKPDNSISTIRDLKAWCQENNFNYSSCKVFSKRKVQYKNHCFVNLDRDGDLNKNDYREIIETKQKKFRAGVFELELKNNQKFTITNLGEFCRVFGFSNFIVLFALNNNLWAYDLFKIKKLYETRSSNIDLNYDHLPDEIRNYQNNKTIRAH